MAQASRLCSKGRWRTSPALFFGHVRHLVHQSAFNTVENPGRRPIFGVHSTGRFGPALSGFYRSGLSHTPARLLGCASERLNGKR